MRKPRSFVDDVDVCFTPILFKANKEVTNDQLLFSQHNIHPNPYEKETRMQFN